MPKRLFIREPGRKAHGFALADFGQRIFCVNFFHLLCKFPQFSYQIRLKNVYSGAPRSGCRAATELPLLACGSAALKGGPRTPAEGWPPSALPTQHMYLRATQRSRVLSCAPYPKSEIFQEERLFAIGTSSSEAKEEKYAQEGESTPEISSLPHLSTRERRYAHPYDASANDVAV